MMSRAAFGLKNIVLAMLVGIAVPTCFAGQESTTVSVSKLDSASSSSIDCPYYQIAETTHDKIRARTLAGDMVYNNKKKQLTVIDNTTTTTDCSGFVSYVLLQYFEKSGIKDALPVKQLKSWDFANIARVINGEKFVTKGREKSTTPKETIEKLAKYFNTVDIETSKTNGYNIKKYAKKGDLLIYLEYIKEKEMHRGHVEIYSGDVFQSGDNVGDPKVLSCGSTLQMKQDINTFSKKKPLKYILRMKKLYND